MELFVTDLDGTMLYNENTVKDSTINLIKEMQKKGIKVATATGRILSSVKFLKEEFGMELDYYILGNGSVVADKDFNVIYQKTLDYNIVKSIYKYLDTIPLKFLRNALSNDYVYCFREELEKERDFFVKSNIDEVRDKDLVSFVANFEGNKPEDISEITKEIREKFPEVEVFQNKHFIDMAPKNVSKATGVEFIAEKFTNLEKVYTIGDSFNDIPMLRMTKNSFTFHSSPKIVRENAGILVENFDESIEKYVLK